MYNSWSGFYTPRTKREILSQLLPRWSESWGVSKTDLREMAIGSLKKFYRHKMFVAIGEITRKRKENGKDC